MIPYLEQPSIRIGPLLVRAALLDAPSAAGVVDTVRFTKLSYARPTSGPSVELPSVEEVRQDREKYKSDTFFSSGFMLPTRGQWLVVATSGDDWGCLLMRAR